VTGIFWVEETDLSEHACLVPIDVLVRDLVPFKLHHHDVRHSNPSPGRRDTGKHEVDGTIVREKQNEFVDHLVFAHGPRDLLDSRVGRHFAHEMLFIEIADAGIAITTGKSGDVEHIRFNSCRT